MAGIFAGIVAALPVAVLAALASMLFQDNQSFINIPTIFVVIVLIVVGVFIGPFIGFACAVIRARTVWRGLLGGLIGTLLALTASGIYTAAYGTAVKRDVSTLIEFVWFWLFYLIIPGLVIGALTPKIALRMSPDLDE